LQTSIRETDFAARYGGDEFLVIAPSTGAADALALAARIQSTLKQTPGDHEEPLSVSIGVSELDRGRATVAALLEDADRALYQSKGTGRDRSTLSPLTPRTLSR
jgi:diguanylate cyclase (GGDEF)-like protein